MKKNDSRRQTALVCAAVLLLSTAGAIATTRLDPSFGTGGLILDGPIGNGAAGAMLLLPDGSFLVERGAIIFPELRARNRLQRYSPSGVLDPTFGTGGTLVLPFTNPIGDPVTFPMARQNDGKIVVGGQMDFGTSFAFTRFGPNGESDPTFGGGSVVETFFAPLSFTALKSVTIASNGEIVAAGSGITSSNAQFIALARYRPDGSLVSTFGTGGELLIPGDIFEVNGLFSFEDGHLLVTGAGRNNTFIYRLLPSGALDASFGSGGLVSDPRLMATATTLDSNDRILAASGSGVTRYLSDGSPDTSFGTGGMSPASSRIFESVRSIRVAIDGGILLTGIAFSQENTGFLVQKLGTSGGADQNFGNSGVLSVFLGKQAFGAFLLISGSRFITSGMIATYFGDLVSEDMFIARFADLAPAAPIPSASPLALALTALALGAGAVALLRRG